MKDITLQTRLQALQPAEFQRQNTAKIAETAKDGPSFAEVLKKTIEDVSGLEQEADKAVQALATGKSDNLHEAMIALQKADLSFKAMMEIRDKLINAYKEIMRLPV